MNRLKLPLRSGLLAFLVISVSWTLACSSATPPPAGDQSSPTADQPQYGGTVRLFGLSIPDSIDPIASASTSSARGSGGIYERLVEYDYADRGHWQSTGKIVPALAERWEISPDGKTYTFFLRKGVKWHDGEEFTADDILFTYNRVRTVKSSLVTYLKDVIKFEAPDPYTIKMTNSVASVEFLGGLTTTNLGIQAKHLGDKDVDFKAVIVGTGPFKLGSHDSKTQTVWLKNENYWQKGLPYLDRVEVIWPLDKSAMLAAFASGVIDTTGLQNKADFDTLRKSVPTLQFIKGPFGTTTVIYINIEHSAFKDVRVRRAMGLAVDRQDLAKLISEGDLWLNCVFPSVLELCPAGFEQRPGYRQPKDQDIAEAKRLLAEAGYPNGFEFKFVYSIQLTQSVPIVEPFANYMAKIGINAVPDGRDTASYNAADREGTYDARLGTLLGTTPSAALNQRFHTKGVYNKHGMGTPELDQLLDRQSQTFNEAERKKILMQIEQIIQDNAWIIDFVDATQYVMAQPWLKGPMILNAVNNGSFGPAPVMGTAWIDQKLAPKR